MKGFYRACGLCPSLCTTWVLVFLVYDMALWNFLSFVIHSIWKVHLQNCHLDVFPHPLFIWLFLPSSGNLCAPLLNCMFVFSNIYESFWFQILFSSLIPVPHSWCLSMNLLGAISQQSSRFFYEYLEPYQSGGAPPQTFIQYIRPFWLCTTDEFSQCVVPQSVLHTLHNHLYPASQTCL